LAYWAVLDYIKDDIPDISDDTVKELITAFDGAALHGWENGDNQPKLNRIKKALFDVLGDEEQTEKAFACIAKHKYNVTFEPEQPEKQPDSLTFHFGKGDGDEWVSESDIVHDFALAHLRTCDNSVPIVYPFYHGGIIKKVNQVNLTWGIKIFCAKTKNESEIEKSSDFGRKFGRNPVEKRSFTRNFSTKLVRK
jgi:hypothetical protein rflaF_20836